MSDLRVRLGRIELSNPVMTAGGCVGYGLEYAPLVDLSQAGAIVVKTLTLAPRPGNPPPRVAETPAGMVHAIGMQNEGIESFLIEILPRLRLLGVPLIVSVGDETLEEYCAVARLLSQAEGVLGIELNLACPDKERNRLEWGLDPIRVAQVVSAVRQTTDLPLIAKLAPNAGDIVELAQSAVSAGAEILCLINSPWGVAVEASTRRFRLSVPIGGLSGPAIKPIALACVWRVHQAMPQVPIIGVGGITNWEDALEFLLVGASAVQIGTAHYIQPTVLTDVLQGLRAYLHAQHIERLETLIGSVQT